MIGVLIRVYASQINSIIPSIVFPQIIGCFVVGWASTCEYLLNYPNLKIGLITGLCGSITSFSAASLSVFLTFSQFGFFNGLAMIILIYGLSFAAFVVGQHVSLLPIWASLRVLQPLEDRFVFLSPATLFTGALIWSVFSKSLYLPLSLIIGPFGTLLRFFISFSLNHKYPSFPIGTFSANMIATTFSSILVISNTSSTTRLSCSWINAFISGFCGCLSTISTLIAELSKLEPKHSYTYGVTTMLTGLFVNIIITGSFIWTNNKLIQCDT